MAIDFPTSPSVGDTTTAEGITYKWDGSGWVITTGAVRNAVDTMSSGTIDYNAGSYHVLDLDSASSSTTLSVSNLPTTPEKHTLQMNFTEELEGSILDGVIISAQDTGPYGIFFKSDGTRVYIVGSINRNVYQYTLSTAWDLSTASYDSVSFSVASQDANPRGIFFKNDGTRMYMVGITSDRVYQYTLSTAWDLSTASYDSISFSVASQDGGPWGIFFKSDGTRMYMFGFANDTVYQYTLSTAWDLSTASYDSVSFSVASQDTSSAGLFFSSDGTRMYIVGFANDTVYRYTLSTAWDLSTASYDSVSFSVVSQDTSPVGIFFKSDGTKMYMVGYDSKNVYQYTLSTVWDLSTASYAGLAYDNVSFSVASQDTTPYGIFFKSDGTKMYISGDTSDRIYQYSLSTAWDLSTASYDSVSYLLNIGVTSLFFDASGTRMFVIDFTNKRVIYYPLSVAWDLSSASYTGSTFTFTQEPYPTGLFFKSDGTRMYIVGYGNDTVYQYTLSTAWDLSTASYDSVSFSVASQDTSPFEIFFKSDGTRMYMSGTANDTVYQYTLSTAWDLSTASYDNISFRVASQDTSPYGIFFKSDGTRMYMIGANDTVYQYSTNASYDVTWPSEFEFNENTPLTAPTTQSSLILELYNPDNTKIYATQKFNNG